MSSSSKPLPVTKPPRAVRGAWILLCIVALVASAQCSRNSSRSAVLGRWKEVGKREVLEFFQDGRVSIENGGTSVTGSWLVLDDGRLKVEAGMLGVSKTMTARITSDTLIFADGSTYARITLINDAATSQVDASPQPTPATPNRPKELSTPDGGSMSTRTDSFSENSIENRNFSMRAGRDAAVHVGLVGGYRLANVCIAIGKIESDKEQEVAFFDCEHGGRDVGSTFHVPANKTNLAKPGIFNIVATPSRDTIEVTVSKPLELGCEKCSFSGTKVKLARAFEVYGGVFVPDA